MSYFEKTYDHATYFPDGVVYEVIRDEANTLPGILGVVNLGVMLRFTFSNTPDQTTLDALELIVTGYIHLDQMKKAKTLQIQDKSAALMGTGFEYPASSGKFFALSQENQINMIAVNVFQANVTWPVRWNTLDGLGTHDVVDSTDMATMALTAVGTKRAIVDSGTALLDAVRDAQTVADLDAVVDNR
jgi:hypothetical protein